MMSKGKTIICSVAAIVILIVSQTLAEVLASLIRMTGIPAWICNALAGVIYLALAVVIVKIFYKKVMHVEVSEFGITGFSLKWKWILAGILLPTAVMAVYLLLIPGEFVSSGMSREKVWETLSAGIFFTGLGAGFVEEIVFRGVIFRSLEKAWNTKVAVIVPSVLFGAVHILGMKFTIGSSLLVILAGTAVGIMFSLITMESGSVWCSGLTHMLWNIMIIGGGLTVAGQADEHSIMTYVLRTGSFAVTGGEFGIESSVIALAGYLIVSMIAFLMIKKAGEGRNNGI